jgi:hypothetical protein
MIGIVLSCKREFLIRLNAKCVCFFHRAVHVAQVSGAANVSSEDLCWSDRRRLRHRHCVYVGSDAMDCGSSRISGAA